MRRETKELLAAILIALALVLLTIPLLVIRT